MLIYMFLTWRMLYIYSKLFEDIEHRSCCQRLSGWLSKHQNFFIVAYFLIDNVCNWICWYLIIYTYPYDMLTENEILAYLTLNMVNFSLELALGIIFIFLWRFFNEYTKSPQFGITRR